jgi:predicted MFS family arabinose efflux permease
MSTSGTTPATPGAGSRPELWTAPFVMLLVAMLLGYASNNVMAPVLPVVILDQGGDAALVGVIVALFSIPSVLLRPPIGRLVDDWSRSGVFRLGMTGMVLSCAGYLVPFLPFIAGIRLLHGTAWAAFNTGANAALADMAPPSRRGEASGIFSLMPSVASMVMPAVGLMLLGLAGAWLAFAVATAFAVAGLLVAQMGPWPPQERRPSRTGEGFLRSLIERHALLPMVLEFLWMSTNVLFFIFPPVWAAAKGIPVEQLVVYYPVVGLTLVIARFVIGRRLDRFPRGVPILVGVGFGAAALLLAATADTVLVLTAGASLFAIGSAMTSPMHMTIVMDRADPRRRGAAMATYSLGYQLGFGVGAAVFGLLIDRFGFPVPFVAALGAMTVMALLVLGARRDLLRPQPAGLA